MKWWLQSEFGGLLHREDHKQGCAATAAGQVAPVVGRKRTGFSSMVRSDPYSQPSHHAPLGFIERRDDLDLNDTLHHALNYALNDDRLRLGHGIGLHQHLGRGSRRCGGKLLSVLDGFFFEGR